VGTQYRSVIFPLDEEQKRIAKEVIEELNPHFGGRIVTTIEDPKTFYPAERYHQNFFERNPHHPYCQAVIVPKIAKFDRLFGEYLR